MKFEPRGYQREAIDFILSHPSAALFLDMSLGKTVIALSAVSLLHAPAGNLQRVHWNAGNKENK